MARAAQSAAAAPAVHTGKAKATGFVTVACKIPQGLILQLCQRTTYFEDTPSGTRERVRFDKCGKRYVARGTSYPNNPPAGYAPRPIMIGGYALTQNIPADFWEEWQEQNRASAFIENHMLFAFPSLADVRSAALEHKDVVSGFEPIIPDKDWRIPKPVGSMTPIETADEMKSRMQQVDEAALAAVE